MKRLVFAGDATDAEARLLQIAVLLLLHNRYFLMAVLRIKDFVWKVQLRSNPNRQWLFAMSLSQSHYFPSIEQQARHIYTYIHSHDT